MKLKELISTILTYKRADQKKLQFMKDLMICEKANPEIKGYIQKKTIECEQNGKDQTEYLQELYDFWITGNDLMIKISRDIQMDES